MLSVKCGEDTTHNVANICWTAKQPPRNYENPRMCFMDFIRYLTICTCKLEATAIPNVFRQVSELFEGFGQCCPS